MRGGKRDTGERGREKKRGGGEHEGSGRLSGEGNRGEQEKRHINSGSHCRFKEKSGIV